MIQHSLQENIIRTDAADGFLQPVLIHVHIPKCAGTSFNLILQKSFGNRFLPLYDQSPRACWPHSQLAQVLIDKPDVLAVSSHSIRSYPSRLGERTPLYITFLRDPLEWLLSNMTYLITNFDQLSDAHRAGLPTDCKKMSVRELLMWLRERNETENRPVTNMLSHIAGPTAVNELGHCSSKELSQLGNNLLDQFFFVGIVEHMSLSIQRLKRNLQSVGLRLIIDDIPTLNTSSHVRGDLTWLTPEDPIGNYVLTRLEPDRQLYQHALARFQP